MDKIESPDTIYGRLKESVHMSGYTMERACIGLEMLLENEAWKKVGGGFKRISDFLETINLSQFRIAVDRRKKLAKRLAELDATQRATARALGVSHTTVQDDLGNNLPKRKKESAQDNELQNGAGKYLPPRASALATDGANVARMSEKSVEKSISKNNVMQKIETLKTKIALMPEGIFECIVVDPPWAYGTKYDPNGRRVGNPYPEMSQDELLRLNIPAADDSIMFLWTTHKFIMDAMELLKHWGFKYRNMLVWDKDIMGMGELFRMQCEFCLIGIKGKPVLNNPNNIRDIIREKRREHSRKPEAFYTLVERLCVGRKLDIFGRTSRENWAVYGNDAEKYD